MIHSLYLWVEHLLLDSGMVIGGSGRWQVTNKIQLTVRPAGIINTSPVTSTLPVLYRTINTQHVHIVQMADADSTDTLRCRWSTNNIITNNFNGYDECATVCSPTLPLFTLFSDNCTLVYTITVAGGYYAVALQIEDYYNSTTSTPLSSVPLQFLFYGVNASAGCSTPPTIIGVRPNLGLSTLLRLSQLKTKFIDYLACFGTPISK